MSQNKYNIQEKKNQLRLCRDTCERHTSTKQNVKRGGKKKKQNELHTFYRLSFTQFQGLYSMELDEEEQEKEKKKKTAYERYIQVSFYDAEQMNKVRKREQTSCTIRYFFKFEWN
jgi:hypothetical protein